MVQMEGRFGWEGPLVPAQEIELIPSPLEIPPVTGSTSLAVIHIDRTHPFKATSNNRSQNRPKVAYGLAGYGRTSATTLISPLNVARHGDVEIEEVRSISMDSMY
jgi:hypothetical protein